MKEKMFSKRSRPARLLIFILFASVTLLAFGGVVMVLWNAILPSLLHVGLIGYWQAVGLLLLCKILFSSFGRGPNKRERPFGGPPAHIREKFMNMNAEEKEALKEKWQKRCEERKK